MRAAFITAVLVSSPSAFGFPSIAAHRLDGETVTLDGHLDDVAWRGAEWSSGFVERTPTPGAQPAVPTRFRVLYDRAAIYVGVEMTLAPGEVPVARELRRDSFAIYADDALTLKIDVRNDKRSTLGFGVNVAGAQIDYIALENGTSFRTEHDAVWQAATSVDETAWYAEVRLPAAALGLSAIEGERIVGLQLSRDHNARIATYDWSPMPPEYGPVSAAHYGAIRGLKDMASGTPVSLIPYVLATHPNELKAGGDAKIRIAEDLWGELTVFTDFAQVDLDDPVVNLDRFALFLPEKRPFFLAGLDVFDFGVSGATQLFFSRRIGLDDDGEEVPIYVGAKGYGRVGPVGLGLLEVITEDASFTVARVRAELAKRVYLGTMATLVGTLGSSFDPRWSFGVDARARTFDERLDLSGFVALTPKADADTEDELAGQVALNWVGESFMPQLGLRIVREAFDPDVGFVSRANIARIGGAAPYVYRTDWLGLTSLKINLSGRYDLDASFEDKLGYQGSLDTTVEWRNGWEFGLGADLTEDIVDESFDLFDDVTIAPGVYNGARVRANASLSSQKNPSGGAWYEFGNHFFGGTIQRLGGNAQVVFGRMLRLSASPSLALIDLPGHDRKTTFTLVGVMTVTPTTDISADISFRLNTLSDSAILLSRIRWRYLPGSDAFLVYREDIDLDRASDSTRSITLKAAFRFDAVL